MIKTNVSFCAIEPFDFSVCHLDGVITDYPTSHIHDQCEIYVNLSGNVSFMVEGQLYPIQRGSVIITRPIEYHHCIYHDFSPHEHFWILFSCNQNEKLLDMFFQRPAGKGNLITLSEQKTEELIEICHTLTKSDGSSPLLQYHNFFSLLTLLSEGGQQNKKSKILPKELQQAISFINKSYTTPIQIKEVARQAFISINTLERLFKAYLGITPSEYIRKKRLSHGARLLRQGNNVSYSAIECGVWDVSQFIALFKKEFGQTPLQYKKQYE